MDKRCKFWLPKKKRFCANAPLTDSSFCGNHAERSDGQWMPCPIDPSHSVLREKLGGHLKRCPLAKQAQSLSNQPFYQKGLNAGKEDDEEEADNENGSTRPTRVRRLGSLDEPTSGSLDNVSSEMKRNAVHAMAVSAFLELIERIESVHGLVCKGIEDSYKIPEACSVWVKRQVDRKLPFQEKHVMQQVSILGNLEEFGVLKSSFVEQQLVPVEPNVENGTELTSVVEFGAGRGYLTQMLADCYGIKRVFLVERKSYKLKADRSLRQKESLILERLRIDIEDLNLNAVESLQGHPYLAIGKHLCGPATDFTLRCCLANQSNAEHIGGSHHLKGLAIATCCHHLCQWKNYISKKYLSSLGISREEFHAITWFTSWAVDADHGSDLHDIAHCRLDREAGEAWGCSEDASGVEGVIKKMKAIERAKLGLMCKEIIDMGRLMWIKDCGLATQLVKYVPSSISPENHLLIAKNVLPLQ